MMNGKIYKIICIKLFLMIRAFKSHPAHSNSITSLLKSYKDYDILPDIKIWRLIVNYGYI